MPDQIYSWIGEAGLFLFEHRNLLYDFWKQKSKAQESKRKVFRESWQNLNEIYRLQREQIGGMYAASSLLPTGLENIFAGEKTAKEKMIKERSKYK